MHQQIKGSPDTIAENIRAVVDALANAGINIEAIAPDFDPPHVRVLVKHNEPYDPQDPDDVFNQAIVALTAADLEPTRVRAVDPIRMPNQPAALQAAMDKLESEGHVIESVLVLPGADGDQALVSFGVAGNPDDGWDVESVALRDLVEDVLRSL